MWIKLFLDDAHHKYFTINENRCCINVLWSEALEIKGDDVDGATTLHIKATGDMGNFLWFPWEHMVPSQSGS